MNELRTGYGCFLALLRWFKPDDDRDRLDLEIARDQLRSVADPVQHIMRMLPKDVSPHIRVRVLYCVGRTLVLRSGEFDEMWSYLEPIWRAIENDHVSVADVDTSIELQDAIYSKLGIEHVS